MDLPHAFLLIGLALSSYCAGAAWLIQAANYPLFRVVPAADFVRYHDEHTRRIGLVMILPAFVANLAAVAFIFLRPAAVPLWAALVNAALGLIILFVTVGIEIPKHSQLSRQGQSEAVIRSLIANNWPRPLGFSAQSLLMLWMVSLAFAAR